GLDGLTLTSAALTASASGHASAATADLALAVRLPDLALLHEGLGGTAQLDAGLEGPWQSLTARIDGRGEAITLMGKSFERPVVAAQVKIENAAPSGTFTASGRLDAKPVDIAASFTTDATGDVVLETLSAIAGSARLSGNLRWPKGDAPTGTLSFSAPAQHRDAVFHRGHCRRQHQHRNTVRRAAARGPGEACQGADRRPALRLRRHHRQSHRIQHLSDRGEAGGT
ncbi:MAG: hypothetical protein NTU78_19600, partial [Alphaproteobacteria bacterium]|nr:hypothetical protein [Alphaproteobacteria bacterium]